MTFRAWMLSALIAIGSPAMAQVEVKDAWMRATVHHQTSTGAFMRITATRPARIVQLSSPVAGLAEIHEMKLVDNVMRMRAVPALELAAGQTVELKPGGYHVMLFDLKRSIKEGEEVPLTLVAEGSDGQRTRIEVKVPVKAITAMPPMPGKH